MLNPEPSGSEKRQKLDEEPDFDDDSEDDDIPNIPRARN